MPDKVICDTHGESDKTYVCKHLLGETTGLGFNRNDPSDENPFPDAWCDNCEIIRAEYGGWDDVPEDLCEISLLCSGCYERVSIRNMRPSVTLDDLASLRWKCGACEEWHTGPMLDLSFNNPAYWRKDTDTGSRWKVLASGDIEKTCDSFLDDDYCAIDDESFFVRGILHLPIIGVADNFRWGVWGSVSRENFEKLLRMDKDPACVDLPPMFSWLSSNISDYPDTRSLKMFAHLQEPGLRPHFWLERSDHPLSQEYHHGISPERVKEIMFRNLPEQPT